MLAYKLDYDEMIDDKKRAIIIGAGPAGLTAAYELLKRTEIKPIVLEKSSRLGGIAATINYKGNRIDIGGHRFFSKSDRVMAWWLSVLPLQYLAEDEISIDYQGKSRVVSTAKQGPDPDVEDKVMLLRKRKSRIYWRRQFYDYPLCLTGDTLHKLGWWRTSRIAISYGRSVLKPIRQEKNLEEFFINRFGRELYQTFFKAYTEKVWGVSCHEISAAWGVQRIKGLSVSRAAWDFFKKSIWRNQTLRQRNTETSLISQFLYPKYGPGQMWEEVAGQVCSRGGVVDMGWQVDRLIVQGGRVVTVEAVHAETGRRRVERVDYVFFFSSRRRHTR